MASSGDLLPFRLITAMARSHMEGGYEGVVAWSSNGESNRAYKTMEGVSVAHVWTRQVGISYRSNDKKQAESFTYAAARRATFVRYTGSHFSKERTVRTTEMAASSPELWTHRRRSFRPPRVTVLKPCAVCEW